MKKRVECYKQSEVDACIEAGDIAVIYGDSIHVKGDAVVEAKGYAKVEAFGNAKVLAWGNAFVEANENAKVDIRGNAKVEARGNARVGAWGDARVEAFENTSVMLWENAKVKAFGMANVTASYNTSVEAFGDVSVVALENARVEAWGNVKVEAWGNAKIVARENAKVEARGTALVEARGNVKVEAWGDVFIRLFSALEVKASAWVTIVNHGMAQSIEGGRQIDASMEPRTVAEWCELNGISTNVDYAVPDLDAKMLEHIDQIDMTKWHGAVCDETNWCETTHCRAGFAICLAGKAGFELERKYGAEQAGRMIYAVSCPEDVLPNFFDSNARALSDIRYRARKIR